MSKTITQANLTANAEKTYAIDDFPSMVNYANTKNKGYVRFTMNGYGKLSIQKFNNKLDVPLSWRSNVKPEHNKAVRALDGFFGSEAGRTFLADMEKLGVNPEGDFGRDRAERPAPAEGDPFAGRTVVITGTFHDLKRRDLTQLLQDRGAKVTSSVSKTTDLLAVGDGPGADKTAAARRFGTPTMDEAALRAALGLPPVVVQDSLF